MIFKPLMRPAILAALVLFGAAAAPAQRGAPNALGGIEHGQWQLKSPDGTTRRVCVANPASLIQIVHGNTQCEHFVMENSERSATVRYTCPSHGHGRTAISVDTPRVINIQTQGVANGAPFSEQYEGRRIGACS
ncbi:hypothetical protein [Sphingomonas sp. LM7]|uniref:DUF3617 domain-containing protein n=1 Tax=Sphingomonas sp. LM7 TaxID=1938607 RepID=UPI000983F847|nr:hypothetical protein [Sphingomonas sp. LM7]AQR73855.1 hypothetical protein BXU08_09525 [Sphingomonas sp. LM7]